METGRSEERRRLNRKGFLPRCLIQEKPRLRMEKKNEEREMSCGPTSELRVDCRSSSSQRERKNKGSCKGGMASNLFLFSFLRRHKNRTPPPPKPISMLPTFIVNHLFRYVAVRTMRLPTWAWGGEGIGCRGKGKAVVFLYSFFSCPLPLSFRLNFPGPSSPILFTGGATGADYHFARCALGAGHTVRVMSFEGHKETLPKTDAGPRLRLERLSSGDLKAAKEPLLRAGEKLGRKPSENGYVMKLLQRNFFQIREVSSVYAVGEFLSEGVRQDSVRISGGTAWACQMFADRMMGSFTSTTESKPIPLFFFSQSQKAWFQCKLASPVIEWISLSGLPPPPTGKYAGIGTRELDDEGKAAISSLF